MSTNKVQVNGRKKTFHQRKRLFNKKATIISGQVVFYAACQNEGDQISLQLLLLCITKQCLSFYSPTLYSAIHAPYVHYSLFPFDTLDFNISFECHIRQNLFPRYISQKLQVSISDSVSKFLIFLKRFLVAYDLRLRFQQNSSVRPCICNLKSRPHLLGNYEV